MKEQLIGFETAVLAKEKGFNVEVNQYWCNEILSDNSQQNVDWNNVAESHISAPTQSLLKRWLDITYNKYVHVEKHTKNGLKCYSPFIDNIPVKEAFFNDYDKSEEALEKGLQEGLKLIK